MFPLVVALVLPSSKYPSLQPHTKAAMEDSVKTFQSHLTSVMDSLIRASVCEITKLFQDTVNDYIEEISLNRKENEALKLRLRLTENKLRNERKYGMGWAASRRASGLLVSDESGRKRRRSDIPRVKLRGAAGFGKEWAGAPWAGGGVGGDGGAERDLFLVQLREEEGEEEEEDEEGLSRAREESAASIKAESIEMEGSYQPESLRLIQEALQMDSGVQNPAGASRIHLEGAEDPGAGLTSVKEGVAAEQGQRGGECWAAPPIVKEGGAAEEGFGERHRQGAELNGMKAELAGDGSPAGLGEGPGYGLEVQKYIGLDGVCSSEQRTSAAQTDERDAADALLGFTPRPGWPKRGREGDAVGLEVPGTLDVPSFAGASGGGPAPGGGDLAQFCAGCGVGFAAFSDLEHHPCLVPLSDQPPLQNQSHKCGVCGVFAQPGVLRAHQRLHAAEEPGAVDKPCRCAQCGRSFSQPWLLKNHECVPSGERPYRCTLCGKRFTHSRSLERHQLVHTGERPHRCPQCGRSFSRLGNLERHQRIHTGERPYSCTSCGKRFSRVEYLKRHQQVHSAERPIQQQILSAERPAQQ
ncbi:hypothetical protein GJAV_G00156260 [Gymnothorax javanicus]|nr:hypothetical protein GJAV_G00156260 [Gymnothorax javanicus]